MSGAVTLLPQHDFVAKIGKTCKGAITNYATAILININLTSSSRTSFRVTIIVRIYFVPRS